MSTNLRNFLQTTFPNVDDFQKIFFFLRLISIYEFLVEMYNFYVDKKVNLAALFA